MRCSTLSLSLLFGLSCSDPPPDPPPPPTILHATAVDAVTGMPVEGARLLLIEQGTWQDLPVDLTLEGAEYQYRVEAPRHRSEPRPFRRLPRVLVISQMTTELTVVLQPVDAPSGDGAIAGTLHGAEGPVEGALVVATGTRVRSTYSDGNGDYLLSGLQDDLYTVDAHLAGFTSSVRMSVDVRGARVDGIDLDLTAGGVAVGGRIHGGTGQTTVYLIHRGSGVPVPGLEVDTNLGSAWQVSSVPPGVYLANTALELDDGWVFDDPRILGGAPASVAVSETASASLDLDTLPSIRRIAPAASATVSATPELSWRAVDGTDFYVVDVTDESGRNVFGGFDAGGNPRIRVLPPNVSVQYTGETLVPGARYAWRVFVGKRDPLNPTSFVLTAASEALEGDFVVAR